MTDGLDETNSEVKIRIEVLKRQISQYFSNVNPEKEESVIYAESKMNTILDEEPVYSRVKTQAELDEKITHHKEEKEKTEKKNYFGNRHLVEHKKPKRKQDAPVLSKIPQNEVMEILRKDRSHILWGKEIYRWSTKDWELLFKLRDEK